jgi:hypothetical protein
MKIASLFLFPLSRDVRPAKLRRMSGNFYALVSKKE